MTTKYRIVAGFFAMAAILAIVGWLGYDGSSEALRRSEEYSRLATFNVAMSDLNTALGRSAYQVYRFINSDEPADMEKGKGYIAEAGRQIEIGQSMVSDPERKKSLAALERDRREYLANFENMQKEYLDMRVATNDEVPRVMVTMVKALNTIFGTARNAGAVEALYILNKIMVEISSMRASFSRYSRSREAEFGEKTLASLKETQKAMQELKAIVRTDAGKDAINAVEASLNEYNNIYNRVNKAINLVDRRLMEQRTLRDRQVDEANRLNAEVDKQMREYGENTVNSLRGTQNSLFVLGSSGFLIGILCATVIIVLLSKTLHQLSHFAQNVAKGRFNADLSIREKGEIGEVISAIKEIPAVLSNITEQITTVTGKLSGGRFRERLNADSMNGSFGDLAKSINEISNTYTRILDIMPNPLMACSSDNKILFLNEAAQKTFGGDCVNQKCADNLKASQCGTRDCFGTNTMNKNAPVSDETTIYPQGKKMEVAVMATPLCDSKGQPVGFMEVLTDLSEIKRRQAVVLKAADEAGAIADRVAAAAEELAAQVEQISRGAEVQRARMESTVSAMSEMNSTVIEVARNAGQASTQSEDTRKKAQNGANLVNKVVNSIHQVNSVASTLQTNMQELGRQAESIGGVMNVISDIADQTNLLALNAAIEAARAGEAGRGFAVVADEVRKLAEKTMTATKEVGDNISAIQHSAQVNIEEVDTAAKSVHEATELANSSGEALREIVELASANSNVVASIATAAEEQSATSEEINSSLDEINRIVGETADGMVQSSSAVQDLSATAQQLKRVMDSLK